MKKLSKLLCAVLSLMLVLSVSFAPALAETIGDAIEEQTLFTQLDKAWAELDVVQEDLVNSKADAETVVKAIYDAAFECEFIDEGSINEYREGIGFTFTVSGLACIYDYRVRVQSDKGYATPNEAVVEAIRTMPSDEDILLIGPYYGIDSSFTNQYRNEANSLAGYTGGNVTLLQSSGATATAIVNNYLGKSVVIYDSHGTAGYGSSYLCLTTGTGITSEDLTNQWACSLGGGDYGIDGRYIQNHVNGDLGDCGVWMAICEGMMKSGNGVTGTALLQAGAGFVYGYSQSVTFVGDYKYEKTFWERMRQGDTVAQAFKTMTDTHGVYDPYGDAYPIVMSATDAFPSNPDSQQTVTSDWKLINHGTPDPSPTPTPTPAPDPDIPEGYALVKLTVGDVWGDGTGYQMLIDADATAYGTIIPAEGGLTNSGDAPAGLYDNFEYKIPENADGSLTTTNIIINNTGSVLVPAGTYDWAITNPTPGDRIWIASSNNSACPGRYDNYIFEAGKTYEFKVKLQGQNDWVDVVISDGGDTPDPTPTPVPDPEIPDGYAAITLKTDDVWGDGSGYQMLLDADASAYGTLIPTSGPLTSSGDAPAGLYDNFEYKIPENADGSLTTSNMICDSSATILVPAGVYDYCIANPTPGDRIWIASNNGTANGREDDYTFENQKHYIFHVQLQGQYDAVNLEIIGGGGGTPDPTPGDAFVGWYFESQSEVNEWTFVDKDGDGYNWDWNELNNISLPAYEGEGCIYSNSYVNNFGAVNPDNWAISPEFTIPANASSATLSWYAAPQDPDWTEEHYGVYVGTGTDTANYTQLFEETISYSDYKNTTVDLTAYAGQTIRVAFRHFNCTDMFMLKLDQVEVFVEEGGEPGPGGDELVSGWYFESQSEVNEWTFVDKDGDGYNWDWNELNEAPVAYEGAGCIYSHSFVNYFGAVNPDNWAISPEFTIPANASSATLSWYAAPQDPDYPEEHYGVYVGTGTDTANYTQLFEETISYSDYKNTTVDLTAYAGQTIRVAFRHFNCTDLFILNLDQVEVFATAGGQPVEEYTVTFVDGLTDETIDTQIVVAGEDAVAPEAPVHEGYTFVEWDTDFTNVQSDLTVTAVYAINEYTVTFVDGLTGETIDTQTVEHGADAVEPAVPEHVGYHFVEWDVEFTNVTSDLTVTALYEINTYNVHICTTSCGTASPIGDIVVEHGDDLTINMTPDANHYVWYVAVNGEIVAVRPGNVITINDITEDLDIYIVFNTDAPEVTPPTPAPAPSTPPKTGAISMTAIAIMAIVSGAGIMFARKK